MSPALTAKNNEIEQALKARIMELEEELTAARNTARPKNERVPMAIHKKILEWQAAHPNITWIGWGVVWVLVLLILFWPRKSG